MDQAKHQGDDQAQPRRVLQMSGDHQIATGEQAAAEEQQRRQAAEPEQLADSQDQQQSCGAQSDDLRPARRLRDGLCPDQGDGQSDQGVDIFRMRTQDAGHRQGQGDAVAKGEAGDDEGQVSQTARQQDQADQEQLVIDAGEDVHDPHGDILGKAGALQPGAVALRQVESLLVLGEQLFDKGAVAGLDLGEIHMGRDHVEEGRKPQPDGLGVRALEAQLEAAIAGRRRDRPDRPVGPTGAARRADAHMAGHIAAQNRVAGRLTACAQPLGLQVRRGEGHVHRRAGDVPGRMGLAAGMGPGRRDGDQQAEQRRNKKAKPAHR